MFRKFVAVATSDSAKTVIAAVAIAWGLRQLAKAAEMRQQAIADMDAMLAERAARLQAPADDEAAQAVGVETE